MIALMLGRRTALAGGALVVAGAAVFVWKALLLGLPVVPTETEGPWRVELEITTRGSGRGSVRVSLPSTGPRQVIFDESASADRLLFAIRTEGDQRTGVWSGRFGGVHRIVYSFRVDIDPAAAARLPEGAVETPPDDVVESHGGATAAHPAGAPEIQALLATIDLPGEDPVSRVRRILRFVSDEVATVAQGSEDALLTLAAREGRPEGKVRLLVTLLRAAGIPARPVAGLSLRTVPVPDRVVWAEAWIGGWIPISIGDDRLGRRPADTVLLRRGGLALVEATGVEATGHRWRALREHLQPDELAAMMVPANPVLARLSLYRLPVGTQSALRALLLLPVGALVVALFRNVVGVPTFGTFMPVLIALALRNTSLLPGLGMVAGVIVIGIVGRLGLERLRLLLVPRLGVLLCVVVLVVTSIALAARGEAGSEFFGGVLLPMVILTMLIERFSVTLAEEGLRTAMVQAAWSTIVATAVYPLFRSARMEHLLFGFPELVLAIMGLLVWIGGYTGYRVSDLIRFRMLARPTEDA